MSMPQRAQPDETDSDSAPPICTTQEAIAVAKQYAHAPDQEWLCVLYLTDTLHVCGYGLYRGETCPMDITAKELLDEAIPYRPSRLIGIRYHPHGGHLELPRAMPWLEEFYTRCDDVQLPRNYISTYADGYVFDVHERISFLRQTVLSYLPLAPVIAGLVFQ